MPPLDVGRFAAVKQQAAAIIDAGRWVSGPDMNGVPLEVMAVELAGGDLLIIHAMMLRRKYQNSYEVVMRCHER